MSDGLGGRQRGSGRLMSHHCFFAVTDEGVMYIGAIDEDQRHHCTHEAAIQFDSTQMSADEAVRQDTCRYIDDTVFGEGREFQQSLHGRFL